MMRTDARTSSFGDLLRRHRLAAALSQEALAARAGLSERGISNLERGLRRRPYLATVTLLADALALSGQERALFIAAARGEPPHGLPADAGHEQPAAPEQHVAPAPPPLPTGVADDLIGRAGMLAAAVTLLQDDGVRLLTLTGPGGVGKTRLAQRLAQEVHVCYADGVAVITLAPVTDAAHVPSAVLHTLTVAEEGDRAPCDLIVDHLRTRHSLLVLDNFEHVAAAAPLVADLLAACPRLSILVTSRAPLHLRGERTLPVPPLALPPLPVADAAAASAESLQAYGATALFVRRAQEVRPDFMPAAADVPAIIAICGRLDGLPLAIELAAARIKLLSPRALCDRLERRLPLLVGGPRDLPERQQTMRTAIAWSYDLLHAGEQALFRRLAVFEGGATMAAVEAVCAAAGDAPVHAGDLLLWVETLLDNNLLWRTEGPDGEPRVGMLETIREYAAEHLAAAGEEGATHRRHAAFYAALAAEAAPELLGPAQGLWLARLDQDHDNLRAALRWAQEQNAIELGLRLAGGVWRYWYVRGYLQEGRGWLEDLAARVTNTDHAALRATALGAAGVLAKEQADFMAAERLSQASLQAHQELGDVTGAALALNNLGTVAYCRGAYAQAAAFYVAGLEGFRQVDDAWGIALLLNNSGLVAQAQGDYARATALYSESLERARALRNAQGIANALGNLANVASDMGDDQRAVTLFEESLAHFRDLNDRWGTAQTLNNLAVIATWQGADARARRLAEESLDTRREIGDQQGIGEALCTLGGVAYRQGACAAAWDLYREALARAAAIGDTRDVAASLDGLALLAYAGGRPERAVRLWGAATALRAAHGTALPARESASRAQALAAVRVTLSDEGFQAAWSLGTAMPLQDVVPYALDRSAPTTTVTLGDTQS